MLVIFAQVIRLTAHIIIILNNEEENTNNEQYTSINWRPDEQTKRKNKQKTSFLPLLSIEEDSEFHDADDKENRHKMHHL